MTQSDLSDYQSDGGGSYKDEETLRRLYHEEGHTAVEIAECFDVTPTTIYRHMDRCGIERRSMSEVRGRVEGKRSNHSKITEERLEELYVEQQLSIREVAEQIGCGTWKILDRLEEFQIKTRTKGAYQRMQASHTPAPLGVTENGYECWQNNVGENHDHVLVHRLAAVAWFGWDAVVDNVVHHKNNYSRDNREENLKTMPKGEHTKLHNLERDY